MRIKTSELLNKLQRMWICSVHCTYPQQWVFADLTRNIDVNYFTGFKNRNVFNMVFKYLSNKARTMHYRKGLSNASGDLSPPR